MMKISRFYHGGVMVNYRCNAACRHCLYACSPKRRGGYVSSDAIKNIAQTLARGRIGSVHIGGGEPFLDFDGLIAVVRGLASAGVRLDYIETNAFWAVGKECGERLEILKSEGVEALCISIDPFHAEYVPWEYPLRLVASCEDAGLGCFLWKREFLRVLKNLDGGKRRSRAEIEAKLSSDYIEKTAAAYGIRFGGRAVNIEEEFGRSKPVQDLLDGAPCDRLLSTDHFHADMEGFFIPPGCTGIRLPLEETLTGLEKGRYPTFEALYTGGIAALYDLAIQHGFTANENGYPSKCNLCFHIRHYLSSRNFAELDEDFYIQALMCY